MEPPSLKLVVVKGPRECETRELPPGSDVRIGRIVRGNNLPIKDAGISSKHLSIEIESGKWVVRDHDSSNGTILNGSRIPPNTPVDLHDGDSIKIGEYTSIEVKMGVFEDIRLRRNPRRGAAAKGKVFDDVDSVAEVKGQRGRELKEKSEVAGQNAEAVVEPVRKQRRGRTKKGLGLEVVEELDKVQNVDENVRGGEESEHVSALPEKVEPAINKRVTRNSKKQQSLVVVSDSSFENSSENSGGKRGKEKNKRQKTRGGTRGKFQEQDSISDQAIDLVNKENGEEQPSMGGYNKDEKAEVDPGLREGCDKEEDRFCGVKETSRERECQNCSVQTKDDNVEVDPGLGEGCDKDKDRFCSVKETSSERDGRNCSAQRKNENRDVEWPNFEKLTLGELFDFLEVYLPKQIIDETEEMFNSMRRKGKQVREYIAMQKNEKGKLPKG